MEILKINGQAIINPIALTWQESDLESSDGTGRNQFGAMFRDRIAIKKKLSVSFPPMNDTEISTLLNAIEPVFFDLEYPDPKLGTRHIMSVYVEDRSVPVYMYDKTLNQWIWQGLSINFIER